MNTQNDDWSKKKATFVWSGKVELNSTFKRNGHFRKVLIHKTFTHVQEEKKSMSPQHSTNTPSSEKSPLPVFPLISFCADYCTIEKVNYE